MIIQGSMSCTSGFFSPLEAAQRALGASSLSYSTLHCSLDLWVPAMLCTHLSHAPLAAHLPAFSGKEPATGDHPAP